MSGIQGELDKLKLEVARVLKHLATNGVIKEVGADQYIGTPFSKSTNDPTIQGGLTNRPVQYGLKTEKPFFSILLENARLGSAFNAFMSSYAKARPRWIDFYPFKERLGDDMSQSEPFLADVGGGLGHEIYGLNAEYDTSPDQLMLQNLPAIIEETKSYDQLPSNIEAIAHDFFTPQPTKYRGARTYFMRLILHDYPGSDCAVNLCHLRDSMVKGHSRLSLTRPSCEMLTESQWRKLLDGSGLKITGIWQKDTESLIEAMLE
ncbi:hypothetical protein ACJZ2D_010337 [Fusarium nematophilum]